MAGVRFYRSLALILLLWTGAACAERSAESAAALRPAGAGGGSRNAYGCDQERVDRS